VLADAAPEVAPDDAPELVEVSTTVPAPEAALPAGDEAPEVAPATDDTSANA